MNHGNRVNHLGRTSSHRKAMLSNMAASLILHKRITTTVAKAKELRKFVEPLITKAKDNTTHSRRVVFSALKYKEPVKELFGEVAAKVGDRPGGYTRILRTGNRLGDNADMCIMELVDYNETYTTGKKAPVKTRRKRAAGKKGAEETAVAEDAPVKRKKVAKEDIAPADVVAAPAAAEEAAEEVHPVEAASTEATPEATAETESHEETTTTDEAAEETKDAE